MAEPETVSVPVFSQQLGIDPRTVRRAIAAGDIRCVRIGRRWLIPVAELDRLLAGALPGMAATGTATRSPGTSSGTKSADSTSGTASLPTEGPSHV